MLGEDWSIKSPKKTKASRIMAKTEVKRSTGKNRVVSRLNPNISGVKVKLRGTRNFGRLRNMFRVCRSSSKADCKSGSLFNRVSRRVCSREASCPSRYADRTSKSRDLICFFIMPRSDPFLRVFVTPHYQDEEQTVKVPGIPVNIGVISSAL